MIIFQGRSSHREAFLKNSYSAMYSRFCHFHTVFGHFAQIVPAPVDPIWETLVSKKKTNLLSKQYSVRLKWRLKKKTIYQPIASVVRVTFAEWSLVLNQSCPKAEAFEKDRLV